MPNSLFTIDASCDAIHLTDEGTGKIIDDILKDKVETILPDIMRKNDLDVWVIIAREYNEDPIIKTMLPSTWLNALQAYNFSNL